MKVDVMGLAASIKEAIGGTRRDELRFMVDEMAKALVAAEARAEADAEMLREEAWDALWQGAGVTSDRNGLLPEDKQYVDHACMSTYESLCDYFARIGWLRPSGGRVYYRVQRAEAPARPGGGAEGKP